MHPIVRDKRVADKATLLLFACRETHGWVTIVGVSNMRLAKVDSHKTLNGIVQTTFRGLLLGLAVVGRHGVSDNVRKGTVVYLAAVPPVQWNLAYWQKGESVFVFGADIL